jgi:hypothetical protein
LFQYFFFFFFTITTIIITVTTVVIIVITVSAFRPRGPLKFHASACSVSPTIFAHLVGNREFVTGFLSEAFKENGFSFYLNSLNILRTVTVKMAVF